MQLFKLGISHVTYVSSHLCLLLTVVFVGLEVGGSLLQKEAKSPQYTCKLRVACVRVYAIMVDLFHPKRAKLLSICELLMIAKPSLNRSPD